MSAHNALQFVDVARRSAGRHVLTGVSFTAVTGTTLSVLDQAPEGRQQLLQLAAGVAKPTRGQVRVFGGNPYHSATLRKRIGLASPSIGLCEAATAAWNLQFAGRLQRKSGRSLESSVSQALQYFELEHCARRAASRLNASERSALRLARATLHAPSLLLIDEPLSTLDSEARQRLAEAVWERKGPEDTLVLSEHVGFEIAPRCDRVVLLDGGRVIAHASPQQLLECLPAEEAALDTSTQMHPSDEDGSELGKVCRMILAHPNAIQGRKRVWELEDHEGAASA